MAVRHHRVVQTGSILPPETVAACRDADVILSGAVGTHPGVTAEQCPNPEAALIELRHIFDLRISVRTVFVPGAQDVTIVRNITGGAYAGPTGTPRATGPARPRTCWCSSRPGAGGVRHRGRLRPAAAGGRVISVDKASVFATSRLWRRIAHATAAASGIPFADVNVDRAAYELVARADLPSVIVTEGIFGDILSDIVCARAGSPALCGSATINPDRRFGHGATALFEPAHGSSPHRTGSRRSNPAGAWLALADLLAWCPDLAALGLHTAVRRALDLVLEAPPRRTTWPRPVRRPSALTSSTPASSTP